jgi:ribonuclease T1
LALAIIASAALVSSGDVLAREPARAGELPAVSLEQLPVQAQQAHRLILQGGPFEFAKDGSVFGNRERLLPAQARGYYREYTVKTPGASGRGARRIVCGGPQPAAPQQCYYTGDHYASFARIVQ